MITTCKLKELKAVEPWWQVKNSVKKSNVFFWGGGN